MPDSARGPVLFLDFDGVLHRGITGTLHKMPLLCDFLRKHPTVQVVISSTWRLQYTLAELRALFEQDVQSQIIDVTPEGSDCSSLSVQELAQTQIAVSGTRCDEISLWLLRNSDVTQFAILDDEPNLFRNLKFRLVLTDPREGLQPQDLVRLEPLLA